MKKEEETETITLEELEKTIAETEREIQDPDFEEQAIPEEQAPEEEGE